jgi:hypothetical protein
LLSGAAQLGKAGKTMVEYRQRQRASSLSDPGGSYEKIFDWLQAQN